MVFNEKLREIKIGITTIVASKWIVTRKIGEGAFGMVWECVSIVKPSITRALKCEMTNIDSSHESLKMEIFVMRKMMSVNAAHSVQLFGAGTQRNFNYVVMTLLGLSLSDIRKRLPDEKFSLDTLIVIGIQATDSLRELHSAGFVHRDIKPSNYTVGKEQTEWIYLIDFGICREIMYTEDLQTKLKCPRRSCQFRGTTRYCSINAHKRKELGRHDDLISMMYMLLEGHAGSLPWKHKDRVATEKLKSEKEEEMLAAAPKPFVKVFEYLRELTYFISPDYKRVRAEFVAMAADRKLTSPYQLDWDAIVTVPGKKEGKPKTLTRDQLLNPPDIATLYDIPDEFPNEESCSDSDRTIPSTQEQRPAVMKTEEKTQSDYSGPRAAGEEQGSMMQGKKSPGEKSAITCVGSVLKQPDVPTLPKVEKKKEEKESKKDEEKKVEKKDEKKDEKKEEKREKKEDKKDEKKIKDESTKVKVVKRFTVDESGKVKPEKATETPARTPLVLATAATPAATTPATAAAAAAAAATPKKISKEIHVDALTPLKKTEGSLRRKERSEMRKKRREARGGGGGAKSPLKNKAKTPLKSGTVKKSAAESGKKPVRDAPSRAKRHTTTTTYEDLKKDNSNTYRRPNYSAEKTCADDDDIPRIPDKDTARKKKQTIRTTMSREDVSDTKYCKIKESTDKTSHMTDENTQRGISCMQQMPNEPGAAAVPNLSRESLSTMQQPLARSRPRTDHTLSSRRDEKAKVAGKQPTKGTQRKVHGNRGSQEERTKEDNGPVNLSKEGRKPKNPASRGARSRNSKNHHRNLSEERTVEASEVKEKKGGVKEFFNKIVRNPGLISKASRNKTDKKVGSGRSSMKTMTEEPVKDVPTIPKAAGARSVSKKKNTGKSRE
ncbi:hypothetical protein PRIPAC_84796 [Pristionchus pacificus]|nr:hypothetical protein PRIPAC_84796 [Pristionchus pacificus]